MSEPSGTPTLATARTAELDSVHLTRLMQLTPGASEVVVAIVDGPVDTDHSELRETRFVSTSVDLNKSCGNPDSAACTHGTFVAGILGVSRTGPTPGICPACTFMVRAIYSELTSPEALSTTFEEVAETIVDCVAAGARVVNLSSGTVMPSPTTQKTLDLALDYAVRSGAIIVAAAGNQGLVGSSPITRHPGVLTVSASDMAGRPLPYSNLGLTLGRRGLCAPRGCRYRHWTTKLNPYAQWNECGGALRFGNDCTAVRTVPVLEDFNYQCRGVALHFVSANQHRSSSAGRLARLRNSGPQQLGGASEGLG